MPAIVGVVAERGRCLRLPQRTMDVGSHRRGDCAGVRCILSSQSCMAAASSTLLVLPGSGVAGHAARRGRHRPLEALPLAAYKKRLANLGPIWPSWMKAAFCSSPRAGERGAPRASRRWFTTITGTTGSLRWRFLPSARPASGSLSMSLFRTRTSRPRTWGPSCGACCNIRQARSFFCGTRAKSIRGRPSERCSWTIRACKPNSFPSMLQNSTLSSKYGTISRATRPTVCRKTNMISESAFTPTPTGCAVPRTNCVPSSWPQNYRHHSTGNSRYITFAKRNKRSWPRTKGE